MVRLRHRQRRKHPRIGSGTLPFGRCSLSAETHRGADSIHPPCIVLFWQTAFRQSALSGIKGWRIVLSCSYSLSARKGNKHRTCQKRMQGASVYECRQTLFAIGFPNMAGGYEVRNRYFKGCVAPKDITHIRQQDGQRCMCYLFEGFMDYLSFLTIRVRNNPQHPQLDTQDYVILNSVSNLAKAESLLETYTRIGCFLDNDTAGRNTCKKLKEKFGERLLDKSMYYREYKDLNDYLCGKPLSQSAEPIKEKKQVQSARRMMQPPKRKGDFICNMLVCFPKGI